MRVIAGSAGGIHLDVPKRGVRPTMDRVKAAIFSSLADKIIGQKILDLFAGSGALGIEALSRGAASVLFVDEDRQSIAAIAKNLEKTNLQGRVRPQDVFEFLQHSPLTETFGIIFADPPYEKMKSGKPFTEMLLENERLAQLLRPDGIFVLEKRPSEEIPKARFWKLIRAKTYGATEVLFFSAIRNPRSAVRQ
jgi:16S rRNA (guanine966-N2)-methyltransferase